MIRIVLAAWVVAAAVACGADPAEVSPEGPCPEGSVGADAASCVPVGASTCGEGFVRVGIGCDPVLPTAPCAAGRMARIGEKACVLVGVRACAIGFVGDGLGGCAPVLPSATCADGELATPGDASCRSLGSCGGARFGDAPIEPGQIFVDAAYAGGASDGSVARPFVTVQAAIDAAPVGATIRVAAGAYGEALRVSKRLRLAGRCARLVSIAATGGPALDASAEIEVAGLSLSSSGIGLTTTANAVLDSVRVHDTGDTGVSIVGDAKVRLELRSSLVERTARFGVAITGASATIARSVVRATGGHGLEAATRAKLAVEGSVIDAATETGIAVWGGAATIATSVVRGTRARADGTRGQGIAVFIDPASKAPGTLTLSDSFLGEHRVSAVWLRRSSAVIERTTIRGTRAEKDGTGGTGIDAFLEDTVTATPTLVVRDSSIGGSAGAAMLLAGYDTTVEGSALFDSGGGVFAFESTRCPTRPTLALRASLVDRVREHGIALVSHDASFEDATIQGTAGEAILATWGEAKGSSQSSVVARRTLIDANQYMGVALMGARATFESTVVRETKPRASDGGFGVGLYVATNRPGQRADVRVSSSLFEKNHGGGIELWGSQLLLQSSIVRGNLEGGVGREGRGLSLAIDAETKDAAEARILDSLFDDNGDVGVAVFGSTLVVERSRVRGTRPTAGGAFGDGIAAAYFVDRPANVSLLSTVVDANARAGVSMFGSTLSLAGSRLSCNVIDLEAETVYLGSEPIAPVLSSAGVVVCGCNASASCRAVTMGVRAIDAPARP